MSMRPPQPWAGVRGASEEKGTGRRVAEFRTGQEARVISGLSRNNKRKTWIHEGPRRKRKNDPEGLREDEWRIW